MEIVELWTLRIEHDYYRNGVTSCFDVQIPPEMHVLLMRRNLVWRRKDVNEWCLSSFDDTYVDDTDVLALELIAQNYELQYVTDFTWPEYGHCYEIEIPVGRSSKIDAKECMNGKSFTGTQSSIMQLSVPFGKIINSKASPLTTILSFKAICKYWQYILIPRQEQQRGILKLEDTKGTISFGEVRQMDFMENKACTIRSLEKFPLRDFYENIDLKLWEMSPPNDNKRLLLRSLPFPEPTLNLGLAPDTVWRILYF